MAMFVMANRTDSNPVGSPRRSWCFKMEPWKRIFLRERERIPFDRISFSVTSTALTACAASVAIAAPITPIWNPTTKRMSRTILTAQQAIR